MLKNSLDLDFKLEGSHLVTNILLMIKLVSLNDAQFLPIQTIVQYYGGCLLNVRILL